MQEKAKRALEQAAARKNRKNNTNDVKGKEQQQAEGEEKLNPWALFAPVPATTKNKDDGGDEDNTKKHHDQDQKYSRLELHQIANPHRIASFSLTAPVCCLF
jgi:hypothetical protein